MSKINSVSKYRSRRFGILLYPDCESHRYAIDHIVDYSYAMILHDKDVNEDGEILKPHYHVVLLFKNAIWNTALAKELQIELNYIQQIRNEEAALQYLIHWNEPKKYQYAVDCVSGPLRQRLIQSLRKDLNENEKVKEMLVYLTTLEHHITIVEFSQYCSENGYWDVFRRASVIFLRVIDEHNKKISLSKKNFH